MLVLLTGVDTHDVNEKSAVGKICGNDWEDQPGVFSSFALFLSPAF